MAIRGTMAPRKLKIPTRYAGPSGSFVNNGHSNTSSTSKTGRQNLPRPLRNTQYCDSGGRSSIGPSASSRSPASASAGRGSRWKSSLMALSCPSKLSCKPPDRAKQVFPREGLRNVSVRTLLLAPIFVAHGILGGHHNHWNHVELSVSLEVPANLKSVSNWHHHIQQDHAGPFDGNSFLDSLRVVQPDGPVAFFFQQASHQLDFGRRVLTDQDFFVHSRALPYLSNEQRCTSLSSFCIPGTHVSF